MTARKACTVVASAKPRNQLFLLNHCTRGKILLSLKIKNQLL